MSNFDIRITGSANLKQARTEFAKLQAQVAALNDEMNATYRSKTGVNPAAYSKFSKEVAASSQVWRDAAASTGMFEVSQIRLTSATEAYTEALQKQKLTFGQWFKQRNTLGKAAYKEQLAMQQMVARQLPGTTGGKKMFDVAIPTEVNKELDTLGNRFGWFREQVRSASTQLINWGKNTQWAGRQLMVGFTVPMVAFGAAAGVMAYQVNQAITRIQKVYDTTTSQVSTNTKTQIQAQMELDGVRTQSLATATKAAKEYGISAKDSLDVMAALAAQGYKGMKLQTAANEVLRASTLGEIDHTVAMNSAVSMMTIFGDSLKQLHDHFNYMNAVENATSLEMKDFAEAIPIAAKPVEMMGGNIKDLGTMLVAMRAGGIQAVQGANAIKAAMQRLLNPSKAALDIFQQYTHIDFHNLQDQTKGNLLELIKAIGGATQHLSRLQRGQVLAKLFGSYQVTRLTTLMDGLNGIGKAAGQTGDAMKIAGQSTKAWGDVATTELKQIQNSASGKFKRALETLKLQLASVGEPFLEAGAKVMQVLTGIFEKFNALPKVVKRVFAGIAIGGAIMGPLVMLTGLAANFAGNFLKMGVTMTGVLVKFKLLSKESAAAELSAQLARKGFISETAALADLQAMLGRLSQAHEEAAQAMDLDTQSANATTHALEQQALAAEAALAAWNELIAMKGQGYVMGPNELRLNTLYNNNATTYRDMANRGRAEADAAAAERQAKAEKDIASSEGRTAGFGKIAAVQGAIFAAGMATTMVASGDTAKHFGEIAMTAAILGPIVFSIVKALKEAAWTQMWIATTTKISAGWAAVSAGIGGMVGGTKLWMKAFAEAPSVAGHLGAGLRTAGSSMLGMINPVGAVTLGLVAAGAAAYLIYKHIFAAGNAVKAMTDNAKPMADILGYTYHDPTAPPDAQDHSAKAHISRIVQTRDQYTELVSAIREASSEQRKFQLAENVGLQVLDTGGTKKDAIQATQLALQAAEGIAKGKKIALHFMADKNSIRNSVSLAAKTISRMSLGQALTSMDKRGIWESEKDALPFGLGDPNAISHESDARLKDIGRKDAQAYWAGLDSVGQTKATDGLIGMVKGQLAQIDDAIKKNANDPNKVAQLQNLRKGYITHLVETMGKGDADLKHFNDDWFKQADALEVINQLYATMNRQQRINFLQKKVDAGTASQAEKDRLAQLKRDQQANVKIQKQVYMVAKDQGAAADETKRTADNAEELKAQMKALAGIDWTSKFQGAMSSTQDTIASQISDNFQKHMDAATAAFNNAQEARQRALENQQSRETSRLESRQHAQDSAFDARWQKRKDAVGKYYDARINRINNEIKAEQKAEEIRKALFDAEIQRMQRLAEAQNTNIDFNVAFNSGNLDEAAKIRNDAMAKETEYALGDAAAKADKASQARQDRLQKEVDHLNKVKDQRLKNLEEVEKKEKAALDRRQKRESNALAAEQQKQKAALDAEVKANEAANQAMWDKRKDSLDKSLDYFKAFIPKNENALQSWINNVASKYGVFNDNMKGKFDVTSQHVGNELQRQVKLAALGIKSDVRWASVGKDTAEQMLYGALGMTRKQFNNWMVTGQYPSGVKPPTNKQIHDYQAHSAAKNVRGQALNAYHTGGIVGVDKGGYAGMQGHRDEMPAMLLKGEGVLNRGAMSKIGPSGFQALNSGKYGVGGADMPLGYAGILSSLMFRAIANTIQQGIMTAAMNAIAGAAVSGSFAAGKAGVYGDISFDAEQLKNAATIANVGQNMKMSKRDIEIAIMTSITESGLRNLHYGDRDSQGLFQQRPSAGWGTVAQVTNPQYAARKFFEALRGVDGRNNESPWLAAQAVQRSAYSDGSNYRPYWNEAIAIFNGLASAGGSVGKLVQGAGGRHRPVAGRYGLTQGIHDQYTGFPAVDFGVPVGTPVYSVANGRVTRSYDIRGYEPRRAGYGKAQDGFRSYGRVIQIDHGGFQSLYAHLSNRVAQTGQTVKGGTRIGNSGDTGNSSGPHLHFGTRGISPMSFVSLQKGAENIKWDNTIANLHHGESVLTKDISAKFREGVDRFAEGPQNNYTINVDVKGANVNADDIVNKTMNAIRRAENRKPRSRTEA